MSEELKGCPAPWCQFDGDAYSGIRRVERLGGGHSIECPRCSTRTPDYTTEAEAIAAWNLRPAPSSEELREQIARIIKPEIWARRDFDLTRRLDWDNDIAPGWGGKTFEEWCDRGIEPSLAKADEIISLLRSPDAGRDGARTDGNTTLGVIALRKTMRELDMGGIGAKNGHYIVSAILAALQAREQS